MLKVKLLNEQTIDPYTYDLGEESGTLFDTGRYVYAQKKIRQLDTVPGVLKNMGHILFVIQKAPLPHPVKVWRVGYTPADRLTSWGVLYHPCTLPVYKLLFTSQ
jgi:hypothetical protein